METKIEGSMKSDGLTLDHKTLEQMRLIAAQRMSEGERPAALAASFGLHRSWAFKCRAAVRGPGRGVKVLRSRQGTGPSAQAHAQAGASGISLGQWQKSDAVRL